MGAVSRYDLISTSATLTVDADSVTRRFCSRAAEPCCAVWPALHDNTTWAPPACSSIVLPASKTTRRCRSMIFATFREQQPLSIPRMPFVRTATQYPKDAFCANGHSVSRFVLFFGEQLVS